MNNFDMEDLETFLIQAELTNQKVKALAENRLSPEQFDRLEAARAEDKRKREAGLKRIQRQKLQKKKQGRQGKGITQDFQHFCKFCHRQYELPTPICVRCNRNTMTLKQRRQQLEVMVGQYKDKKKKRQERKMKWDMWQKTKAMLWKKTSNNYDKWDYFISDSEQQPEPEPILPKNDPNFIALEKDMQDRKATRIKQTKKAKQLQLKGNAYMKQGKYEDAKNMYGLALQHIKDIKTIYTNRALAYMKLGKFKKAIKDCSDVIEYMEVFEKVEENKDLVFKAYLRRASSKKELKDYKQALEDVNKALTFYPNDKSAEILKKQVEGFIKHSQKIEELLRQANKNPESEKKQAKQEQAAPEEIQENNGTEQESKFKQSDIIKELAEAQLISQNTNQPSQNKKEEQVKQKQETVPKQQTNKQYANPIQQIKQRINNLDEQNISAIFRLLRQKPELVTIFIAAKGIQKCLKQLAESDVCKKEGFLVSVCLRGDGVGEKEVWDFGINKLHGRISEILTNSAEINMSKYFVLEDLFEVLIPMSLHEKYRILLGQSQQTFQFLEKTFALLITRHKKQPDLLSSFIIYMGNLCSGNSKFRDSYITEQKLKIVIASLYQKILLKKTVNKSYLNLKKNIYSLLANIAINQNHRVKLLQLLSEKEIQEDEESTKWEYLVKEVKYYPKSHENFEEYMLALLSLFTNVTLGTNAKLSGLAEGINERFLSNPGSFSAEVINRALLILSRIKYQNVDLFKKMLTNFNNNLDTFKKMKKQKNPMEQIVRILNIIYLPIQGQPKFSEPVPIQLLSQIKGYISTLDSGQMLFCNSCNLFSVILDTSTDFSKKIYGELRPNMKFLIEVAKDKIGNWRKNASILLAKLSLNADCKTELQKHHGMEVLKSIAQFVKEK